MPAVPGVMAGGSCRDRSIDMRVYRAGKAAMPRSRGGTGPCSGLEVGVSHRPAVGAINTCPQRDLDAKSALGVTRTLNLLIRRRDLARPSDIDMY